MKSLVAYYSRKGSNEYLARKIAHDLSSEMERIRPRINVFFLFLFNFNPGIFKIRRDLTQYDRVILVGPIWMGRFIPPLRAFVKRYRDKIQSLVFVTCCGSTYEKKNEKFGHGLVFDKVREALGEKVTYCQAFPIDLVMPEDQKDDDAAFMKTHLNDQNFKGEILERYEAFVKEVLK